MWSAVRLQPLSLRCAVDHLWLFLEVRAMPGSELRGQFQDIATRFSEALGEKPAIFGLAPTREYTGSRPLLQEDFIKDARQIYTLEAAAHFMMTLAALIGEMAAEERKAALDRYPPVDPIEPAS